MSSKTWDFLDLAVRPDDVRQTASGPPIGDRRSIVSRVRVSYGSPFSSTPSIVPLVPKRPGPERSVRPRPRCLHDGEPTVAEVEEKDGVVVGVGRDLAPWNSRSRTRTPDIAVTRRARPSTVVRGWRAYTVMSYIGPPPGLRKYHRGSIKPAAGLMNHCSLVYSW